MNMEFDDDAIRSMYEDIANRIKQTDADLRQRLTGSSVDEVVPAAKDAFADIGLELPDSDWHEYAMSVTNNEDFEFKLE